MTYTITRRIFGVILFTLVLSVLLISMSWSAVSQTQPHVPRPYLVADINPGPDASSPTYLTAGSKTLYAFASDPDRRGVWATDGTEANTQFAGEIYPYYSGLATPPFFATPVAQSGRPVAVEDKLFYVNDDGVSGEELWVSDGSPTGTLMLQDIRPGFGRSSPGSFATLNGQLLFRASNDTYGPELWISDGTVTNTHVLKDIVPGSSGSYPHNLINVDDVIYFRANAELLGDSIWRSDGTESGTWLVVDVVPDNAIASYPYFGTMVSANSLFFLAVYHPTYGLEFWRSDGTQDGTWLLKDIAPGAAHSLVNLADDFVTFADTFYFYANDMSMYGGELWRTDGTVNNTVLVKDINVGSGSSGIKRLAVVNGRLFFTASDGVNGRELWTSDGTENGTVMIADINPDGDSIPSFSLSVQEDYAGMNGLYFFPANDGIHGTELWQSDGTAEGTVMVMDINPGESSSSPRFFAVADNTLYFSANDGQHDTELWALSYSAFARDDDVVTKMGQTVGIIFLENDNYIDPDQLEITITSQPQHGDVILNNSAFIYTPEAGYIGADSFTYTISDSTSEPKVATVSITVEGTQLFLPYIVKLNLLD